MSVILDYVHRIPANLLPADVAGVNRYLSYPTPLNKVIGKPEYDELIAAGKLVTLNWEYQADDWLDGSTTGVTHGIEAARQAKALGYPPGSVIVGSCDIDMTRNQWDRVGHAYADLFMGAVAGAGYRAGVYGPWDVLTWCQLIGYTAFWQAGMSTDWSQRRNAKPWPGAHLRQIGHRTVAGQDTDWSAILIQPLWGRATTKGRSMLRIAQVNATTGPQWFIGDGIFYRPILTPDEFQLNTGEGVPVRIFAPDADWQAWVGRIRARGVNDVDPAELAVELLKHVKLV